MNAHHANDETPKPGALGERLLAQQPPPVDAARFARYRKEIEMTLEQTERRLRWEKWITGGLWIYLVILSVGLLLLGGKHIDSPRGTWFGILAVLWLLYGGIELLKHFMNRYRVDLLKEIKRVELQVVEMREEMAQRGGSRS